MIFLQYTFLKNVFRDAFYLFQKFVFIPWHDLLHFPRIETRQTWTKLLQRLIEVWKRSKQLELATHSWQDPEGQETRRSERRLWDELYRENDYRTWQIGEGFSDNQVQKCLKLFRVKRCKKLVPSYADDACLNGSLTFKKTFRICRLASL